MVPSHVLSLASNTSSDTMEAASLAFMGEWDDKLLFTKAVAEAVIKEEGSNLPITIVRPSLGKLQILLHSSSSFLYNI